ncbi:hypothetical protein GHK62_25615, partial [Sinorhizobium terangae]
RVGRHDNFFELGGHSLLAVQLANRALDLGLKFSAVDIFQAAVLHQLASRVQIDFHCRRPGLLTVRAAGSQPPLFFVPTGYGDYSYVLTLIKEANISCPVYALPWPSFNDLCPLTLESIAAHVIASIKEIQPQGPYRLAGYSSGAILAYAIAQHLLNLNDVVSFVGFIDVTLPAAPSSISDAQAVAEVIFEPLESLDDNTFEVLEKFARQSSVPELLEKARQIGAIVPQLHFGDHALKCAYFHRALRSYRVPSLPIKIYQFYATDPSLDLPSRRGKSSVAPEASSPMRGWDRILSAAAVHTVPVPGNHVTMMSNPENRKALARMLLRALNSVAHFK